MEKFRNTIGWISLICCLLIAILSIVFRLSNADLTETQLMLKMWWLFIPLCVFVYGFYWGLNDD